MLADLFAQDAARTGGIPWPPTLPSMLAGVVVVALIAYALMAGADFGGGVWDLLASGPRKTAQRALVAHAIGPIWEANHVWLIIVVVLLFTCFPPAFALLAVALHIPFALMLIGIVLRGSAFTFRSYDSQHSAVQRRWGRMFAIASVITPILLGIVIGAIASGAVGQAPIGVPDASFTARYVWPWLSPFAVAVGALALAVFAFLAAVYLTIEAAADVALQEDFRRRALGAAVAVFVTAACALVAAHLTAPRVRDALTQSPFAVPFHLVTGVLALAAIGALVRRAYRLARAAAAAQVIFILGGWAYSQYPYIIPPTLTIAGSAAPRATLALILVALVVGALVLFPSLAYLYRVFKARDAAFGVAQPDP